MFSLSGVAREGYVTLSRKPPCECAGMDNCNFWAARLRRPRFTYRIQWTYCRYPGQVLPLSARRQFQFSEMAVYRALSRALLINPWRLIVTNAAGQTSSKLIVQVAVWLELHLVWTLLVRLSGRPVRKKGMRSRLVKTRCGECFDLGHALFISIEEVRELPAISHRRSRSRRLRTSAMSCTFFSTTCARST